MIVPPWFPNEVAHAGDEHLDAEYVQSYDRKAGTDPANELALLLELGLNSEHTLVDFGAGTGTFALSAAPHCGKVIAVDISPAMLDRLRAKAAKLGIKNVDAVQGGFLSYDHGGEPVDFVYSRHALHHLPDFWKAIALQRISSILKPGGILRLSDLVYSFDLSRAEAAINHWLEGAASDARDGWTLPELETHLRDEYSTFSWLLEPMLERSSFKIQSVKHDPSGIYSAYTCAKMG